MGRNVAALRLQCFAAATLAQFGVMDGQQGHALIGESSFTNAEREAEAFEAHPWTRRTGTSFRFPDGMLSSPFCENLSQYLLAVRSSLALARQRHSDRGQEWGRILRS